MVEEEEEKEKSVPPSLGITRPLPSNPVSWQQQTCVTGDPLMEGGREEGRRNPWKEGRRRKRAAPTTPHLFQERPPPDSHLYVPPELSSRGSVFRRGSLGRSPPGLPLPHSGGAVSPPHPPPHSLHQGQRRDLEPGPARLHGRPDGASALRLRLLLRRRHSRSCSLARPGGEQTRV